MFRVLEDINGKNADAMYSAGDDMKVGMGVIKGESFEADFPSTATATDIFIVAKEFIPTGLDSLRGEVSDYDLETIKSGDKIVLIKPIIGEIYWTDQVETELSVGDYLVVNTNGKFTKASSGNSNLKVESLGIKDAGVHTGVTFIVTDWNTISGD
jgi:hypothetical protein